MERSVCMVCDYVYNPGGSDPDKGTLPGTRFADLPEDDLMRSIRLFGEKVMPALRDYEPF